MTSLVEIYRRFPTKEDAIAHLEAVDKADIKFRLARPKPGSATRLYRRHKESL